MKIHKLNYHFAIALMAFSFLFVSTQSHAQGYDPKKDKAYDGYKYRPGQGFTQSKFKLPARPSCVREVTSTIKVNGTLDGKGCLYTFKGKWKGKSYKDICFAPKEISEGMPPMFDLAVGATLKNVQIECALDGVHTSRNNTIDNVIFRDVEEDAITIDENVTVKNSQFWFCNDKCIQMNKAEKATITNNKFYYATSAILANWGTDIMVTNNTFYTVKRGIRGDESKSRVSAKNNTGEKMSCLLIAQDHALVIDLGGNTGKDIQNRHCEINGGRIDGN